MRIMMIAHVDLGIKHLVKETTVDAVYLVAHNHTHAHARKYTDIDKDTYKYVLVHTHTFLKYDFHIIFHL